MADKIAPGMEFASWSSLPSISETFAKQASGQGFNPLMALAGKALDTMAGSSDTSKKMMGPNVPTNSAPAPGMPGYVAPVIANPVQTDLANPFAPPIQATPNALDLWSNIFKFGGK